MNEEICENLKTNLAKLCVRYGCSYKQLSELIDCDASYISKVINGRILPPLDKIIQIANYFEIEFAELFK